MDEEKPGERKLRTERYCTHCKRTTLQNKLISDTVWICRGCGLELFETGRQRRISGRSERKEQ